jgi:hypothetical protein
MTIKQLISEKVALMDANNESYSFLHSDLDWRNLSADECTFPVVYVEVPIKYRVKTSITGYKQATYIIVVFFMYKSELDNNPDQQEELFVKAENAQKQFEVILDSDSDNIASWVSGECTMFQHITNADLSGVMMPLEITLRNNDSVCL